MSRCGPRVLVILALFWSGACVAVPPPVRLPPGELTVADLPATIQAYTGAPVVPGNAAEVLHNGEAIFPALLGEIRAARHRIALEQYTWEEGPISGDIAAALAERAAAGVEVAVLLDAFGSRWIPPEHLEVMRAAGCRVVFARPLSQLATLNNRDHRRVLVVDGRVGFAGDVGFGRWWAGDGRTPDHWRATHVRVEGPIVAHLERAFAEQWHDATGRPWGPATSPPTVPRGAVVAQVVHSAPLQGRFGVHAMLRLAVAAARRTLYITGPYFLPDESLLEDLRQAARRGVRVVLLGPGPADANLVRGLTRRRLAALLRDGVEVYEYLPARLHTKSLVVDGTWATLGSANLDNRSFALNAELNLALADREVARRLEAALARDLTDARRMDEASWQTRGLPARLREWLAIPLERLL
jgi:cardiolipin synthase A/B